MRILFFSTYFSPYVSGALSYPVKLLNYLATNEHIVNIFTFRYDKTLPEKEISGNLTIQRLPYLFKISKGFISSFLSGEIFASLKKSRIVILNQPTFEGIMIAIPAFILRKPIISLFHCQVELGKGLINSLIVFFLNISIYIQLLLSKKIVTYTKDYAVHSGLLKLFLKKTVFILPPIQKLPVNEKLLDNFKSLKGNKRWIGFCGRIAREKGVEYLIESFSLIDNRGQTELVFAGPYDKDVAGEERYYQEILALLKKKGIPYRFLGTLREGDLGAFYMTIDCLILPSVNKTEAFGIVQGEAMLFGKPVITSDLPGVRFAVSETGMGKIVPVKDSMSLSRAIDDVLTTGEFNTQEKIRKAEKLFTISSFYRQWKNLLIKL